MRHLVMGDNLPPKLRSMLPETIEVVDWDSVGHFGEIEGIVTYGHVHVDDELMGKLPKLKVVSNHGVGVDHIELAAAHRRGIPVGNTPGCLDQSTADMTMALILAVARNVVVGDRFAKGPEFTSYDPSQWIGQEVTGSTLGIIGMGRIGSQVAKRARAFEMPILYHNRQRRPDPEREFGATWKSLEDLLSESDFVSLNCPLTRETTGLIGEAQLRKMKPSAFLINMARGAVVDGAALHRALSEGWIRGAALDVTEPEPLPRDHPLLSLPNLVITPHLGSASNKTRHRMMEMTVENLLAGLAGRKLPYQVHPK